MKAELERAIEDNLDDDAPRIVYADWLQQHGDPRGELAAVQLALAKAPDAELLRARERALFARHDSLAGSLGPIIASAREAQRNMRYRSGVDPIWRAGFLDSFRINVWYDSDSCFSDEDRERWPELAVIQPDVDDPFDARSMLRLVAGHPAARFLRRLRFGNTATDYPPGYDLAGNSVLDTLVELAIPTLRVLELGSMDCRQGETEVSWIGLGDVGKVLRAYPKLVEVKLTGVCVHFDGEERSLTLGTIDMPELVNFELRTTDLRAPVLRAIIDAKWPKLESLVIWVGGHGHGAETDVVVEDILPLLEQPPPRLRHFGLVNCEWTDDAIDPLAASPLLEQIESLDLSLGCLTDDGAATLADHAPAFRHLKRLALDRCQLGAAGIAAVAKLCQVVSVTDQRDTEAERYVAVGE